MYSGAIKDEQGKLNVFAIEPEVYYADAPQTGFTKHAELVNGRAAMIGFAAMLLIEIFTHRSFVSLLLG
jgi:hypothetical protein